MATRLVSDVLASHCSDAENAETMYHWVINAKQLQVICFWKMGWDIRRSSQQSSTF
jgi:hypothetical protein